MFFRKTKKFAVGILLTLFVFSSFTGFIISAQPANAQLGVAIVADAGRQAESIWTTIKNGWKIAVMNAAQQAVGYFMRKVAYDSAVWLASGGKGQNPFAHTSGVGSYLKSVGDDAAGAAIDSFGKTFGLDLCKVPDIKLDLALRIGLHYNNGAEPPKPACNLTTFSKTWGDSISSVYHNGVDPSKVFSASLKVDDTDLGINIKTTEKIDRLYAQQVDGAKADRAEGGGIKAVTGLIDKRIKTPAQVTADEMKANAPNKQNDKSQAQIGAAMGSGAYEIIPSTLSIFLNTLSNQMLKNFRENGMLPFGIGCVSVPGVTGSGKCPAALGQNPNSAATEIGGRAAAEAVFSEFLTPKLTSKDDYDVLTQLNSCDSRGIYNCRADDDLVLALQQAKQGEPVTIAEALQRGFLHPKSKLISPLNIPANTDVHCFDKDHNYCYSNIVVLRQLGILPLGFEIAAKISDPDHPIDLETVVKKFYDCNYSKDAQGNIVGVNYDPTNYPFCHLIDPNWVLKLEQTRCDALGYGSIPVGNDVPDRLQECIDVKTCVGRDSNGHCIGFGNCVREKNVWSFEQDQKCEPQYASCRAFTNSQGQQVAYLYRTLDTGSCNQSNVGCTAYSLNQDNNGWINSSANGGFSGQNSIYLNGKVSTCDESAAGCSMFRLASASSSAQTPNVRNIKDDLVPLKKAPDYLNCYDKNADITDGINWPQTLSDLIKMQSKSECSNFAQVCIASEVGCSKFTNVDDADAPAIPGKFLPATVVNNQVTSWNDQCDARCVGYSAYQELATTYSAGNPTAYIIPPSKYNSNQSGTECTVRDNNCTGFTNMEGTENGGEKVENFTLLRSCIKPDETKQKKFYTYEGSKTGYQLQSFVLQQDPADGSPLTIFKDDAERSYFNQYKCNEALYKKGLADGDCRQFNDDQGKVYYEMLPNTVVVSADCTQYRLNSPELAAANQCFAGGQYKDGACYYYGLPGGVDNSAGASENCTAAAMVSCRAYKGNHGNNIKSISLNSTSSNSGSPVANFETVDSISAANGWSVTNGTISIANESTHAGEHSLELFGTNAVLSKSVSYSGGDVDQASVQSYDLTFWAKGTGFNVAVGMNDDNGQTVNAGQFSANTNWQTFTFHIKLPSSASTTLNNLTFTMGGSGSLFLDNIHLTKVSDLIYLVKNSLKVDSICDDEPADNLPGAALGCTAYNGPQNSLNNTLYYLTNFSYLCRDGAIGCTAFKDTFNKVTDAGPRAYNVFLSVAPPGGVKATTQVGNDTYSCQVEKGKVGCYVNIKGHTKDEIIASKVNGNIPPLLVDSTYIIPADSDDAHLVYLVADGSSNSTCNQIDVGCTAAGKQTITPAGTKYVTTTVKIDPNQFEDNTETGQNGILCQAEAVGCDQYSSSKGDAYFKDPAVAGNKICSFQSITDPTTKQAKSGWFWKDVSVCGSSTTLAITNASNPTYCSNTSDCSGSDVCLDKYKNQQPCYPNYKKNGNYYDIWSFGDTQHYNNFVGECTSDQDTCSEFVDHADNNQAYYLFDNAKLAGGNCSGQVSQKAGCALFDQTENPNKMYNTAATYLRSDSVTGEADPLKATKVDPSISGNLDANRILSVQRDRECAQWLQCKSTQDRWDDARNGYVSKCTAVGLCDRLPSAVDPSGQSANCSEFITGQTDYSNKVLTENDYVQRDVSWKGKDLVGLSILGMYPIEELWQFDVSKSSDPDYRLLKQIPCGGGASCSTEGSKFACASATSTAICGKSSEGVCVNGTCLQDSSGKNTTPATVQTDSIAEGCRAYPDKDSPFPNVTAASGNVPSGQLNRCFENGPVPLNPSDPAAYDCDCNYTKATFGNKSIAKYFAPTSMALKNKYNTQGICLGGSLDSQPCTYSANQALPGDCEKSGGTCQVKDANVQNLYGWKGFCLEYDKSRILGGTKDNPQFACLSWLPLDTVAGAVDINGNNPEASAHLPAGTKYCVASDLYRSDMGGSFSTCYNTPAGGYNSQADCDNNTNLAGCGAGYHVTNDAAGKRSGFGKCDEYFPDWCYAICAPDEPLMYADGKWFNQIMGNFQNRQIGCQAYISLDTSMSGLAPWTDRLWQGYKGVFKNLDVSAVDAAYKDNLNYAKKATSSPFGFANDNSSQTTNSSLLLLRSCTAGNVFEQPLSDAMCATGSTLQSYKTLASNNFAYDGWSFASYPTCNDDLSCNPQTLCKNHETTSVCQFKCKKADGTGDNNKCASMFGATSTCDIVINSCTNTNKPPLKAADCTASGATSNCETNGFVCSGNCSFSGTVSTTLSCTTNQACFQKACVGGQIKECVAIKDAGKPTSSQKSLADKVKEALKLLVQIYAKIPANSIQEFSTTTQAYGTPGSTTTYPSLTISKSFLDITGNLSTMYSSDFHVPAAVAPEVHAVGECDASGNKCMELNENGFNVNGKFPVSATDTIIIDTKPFEADFSFFYHVDSNHMPAKRIIVDPDTGDITDVKKTSPGSFWNQRGYFTGTTCDKVKGFCNNYIDANSTSDVACTKDEDCAGKQMPICISDEDKAPSFGYILNMSCDLHPYVAKVYYNCQPGDPNWHSNCDALNGAQKVAWDAAQLGGCCVYQPKVQVLDNWGWCNGTCVDGTDGTGGCYNGDTTASASAVKECDDEYKYFSPDTHSNTIFRSKIIVPQNKIGEDNSAAE